MEGLRVHKTINAGSIALMAAIEARCGPVTFGKIWTLSIAALLLIALVPYISCDDGLVGDQSHYTTTLDDPDVVFAVQAINDHFSKLGDNNLRTAVQLVDATSQVVSGLIYRFTIQVSGGAEVENCHVAVWSRPWLTDSEATIVQDEPKCAPAV